MLWYFRVYGRGWIVSNSRRIIESKYKKYKEKGLARQPIMKRQNWVELD